MTVYKAHPCASDVNSRIVWDAAIKNQLTSDYSMYCDDIDLDILIRNSNVVYSADSAAILNALLIGKKVASYRPTDLSEIVPIISKAEQIETISIPNIEDISKFINWYVNVLCIDVNKEDCIDKIKYIIKCHKENKKFEEIFK